MNNNNQNVKLILVTAIICIALCIPLGLLMGKVLFYDNDSSNINNSTENQTNNETNNNNNNSTENQTNNNNNTNGNIGNIESNRQVCEGFKDAVYKGEYHKDNGNYTLNEYLTLTLKKDGTFLASYENSEEISGTYTIKNNILTTTSCPIGGPCDEKNVLSYNITSDCSTILWGDPEYYQYNIYLK